MDPVELQQTVDAVMAAQAAAAKAAADAKKDVFKENFAKVRAWVMTHAVALAVGGGLVLAFKLL